MRRRVKLGQHFLNNQDVLAEIIKGAAIKEGERIIEIGPGKGVLTRALLEAGARVTAVEIDNELVEILRKELGNNKNFKIINQDALDFIPESYLAKPDMASPDKLIGNIPYQITSPLLRKIFKLDNPPELIILMVQKEVAERICAKPGDSRRGFLSVVVQYYAKPEIIRIVPKESFYPIPRVESAIIKINLKSKILNPKSDKRLFKIVQAGFSQKRKKLRNSLAGGLQVEPKKMDKVLQKIGIDSNLRAEDLEMKEWLVLAKNLGER